MPLDVYYQNMTPQGKVRNKLIKMWPSIYNVINHIFSAVAGGIAEMVRSMFESLKP